MSEDLRQPTPLKVVETLTSTQTSNLCQCGGQTIIIHSCGRCGGAIYEVKDPESRENSA